MIHFSIEVILLLNFLQNVRNSSTSCSVFNGPVTPTTYSTIVITWTIARTISCTVIAIAGPITSENAPT